MILLAIVLLLVGKFVLLFFLLALLVLLFVLGLFLIFVVHDFHPFRRHYYEPIAAPICVGRNPNVPDPQFFAG